MASEIVVGIDFGTTYSGVSWAINSGKKQVRVINDWPNPTSTLASSDKVPTIITYENGKPPRWGFAVDPVKKEDCVRWIKLLLDPKHTESTYGPPPEALINSSNLLQTLHKTADEVAADYLGMLWEYTKEDIRKQRGDKWESIYTVKVVLTVPAIWDPAAQHKTMTIARRAGLPHDISIVTEPEAAALGVLKEKSENDEPLEKGDCFVVCDAGGGTVDLISYKITGLKPLAVEECAIGAGDLCGSMYLDIAFQKYVKTIVGDEQYDKLHDKAKRAMMREFEQSVKRCYNGDDEEHSVDLWGVADNPKEHINCNNITLKPTVLKTIFDHVIGRIMRLVEQQITESQAKGNKVKAILLVGGFGTNRYMHHQLTEAHKRAGIQVLQNHGAWSVICRGATLWGLENSTSTSTPPPTPPKALSLTHIPKLQTTVNVIHTPIPQKTVRARITRYSYGIVVSHPFNENEHRWEDRIRKPDDQWYANNQMHWFVKKGERVEVGNLRELDVRNDIPAGIFDPRVKQFTTELFYSASEDPPSRKDDSVKVLCQVQYGARVNAFKLKREKSYYDPVTKQKWRAAHFKIKIAMESPLLRFMVEYKGETVAYTEASYVDPAPNAG